MFLEKTKQELQRIFFDSDTKEGRLFDIVLLFLIMSSVLTVIVESVQIYSIRYRYVFIVLEWFFTGIFALEYILRIFCSKNSIKYIKSPLGIVDLVSVLPSFLLIFFSGLNSLLVIRSLRILRVFRIFKLTQFLNQGNQLTKALKASLPKITVFLLFVFLLVIILGSFMYLVEGGEASGFKNIPLSIYWAIVTLTTVGYGDIHPVSPLGRALASLVMMLGYAILAVPTGIVSAEMVNESQQRKTPQFSCRHCREKNHIEKSSYCRKCGTKLNL